MKSANQFIIFMIICLWMPISFAEGDHDNHQSSIQQQNKKHGDKHHDEDRIITLSPGAIKQNQIEVSAAKPHQIEQILPVFGKIVPVQNKQIAIYPRFAGVIKSLPYQLGDQVKRGSILATIESNNSLQNYTVKAPFSGTLIKQYVSVGKLVKTEQAIYELVDLSSVWVKLFIYRKDASHVSKGDKIYVNLENNNASKIESRINYISPVGNEHTQSIIARATLSNRPQRWIPGLYVDAQVVVQTQKVSVAVSRGAIQNLDGKVVVFVETKPNTFSPEAVKIGLRGDHFVQILSGVKPGMRYVSKNSFILKAELEKSRAEHSH